MAAGVSHRPSRQPQPSYRHQEETTRSSNNDGQHHQHRRSCGPNGNGGTISTTKTATAAGGKSTNGGTGSTGGGAIRRYASFLAMTVAFVWADYVTRSIGMWRAGVLLEAGTVGTESGGDGDIGRIGGVRRGDDRTEKVPATITTAAADSSTKENGGAVGNNDDDGRQAADDNDSTRPPETKIYDPRRDRGNRLKAGVERRIATLTKMYSACRGKERLLRMLLLASDKKVNIGTLLCRGLPTDRHIEDLYGPEPIVHGLDTCQAYRDSLKRGNSVRQQREQQFLVDNSNNTSTVATADDDEPKPRVAGLYNTGTNALSRAFNNNLKRLRNDPQASPYEVAWGKHLPPDRYRLHFTYPPDSKWKKAEDRFRTLPVVLIRDPFWWFQSMVSYCARDVVWKNFVTENHLLCRAHPMHFYRAAFARRSVRWDTTPSGTEENIIAARISSGRRQR